MDFDVIVVGTMYTDLIFSGLPRFPELDREVYADSFMLTGGGAAFITAVAASRLGLRVAVLSAVGTDPLSARLVEMLIQEGVNVTLLNRMERPLYHVSVSVNYDNDRALVSYDDVIGSEHVIQHAVQALKRHRTHWVHMPAAWSSLSIAKTAKQLGYRIAMDVGWDEEWLRDERLKRVVQLADLFTPNLEEAKQITGAEVDHDVCQRLVAGHAIGVVTRGSEGALVTAFGESPLAVDALPMDAVQDTTGAGDNFSAGLLWGLIRGYSTVDAVRAAMYCGSVSTTGLGGTAKSPYESDLMEWLAQQGITKRGAPHEPSGI